MDTLCGVELACRAKAKDPRVAQGAKRLCQYFYFMIFSLVNRFICRHRSDPLHINPSRSCMFLPLANYCEDQVMGSDYSPEEGISSHYHCSTVDSTTKINKIITYGFCLIVDLRDYQWHPFMLFPRQIVSARCKEAETPRSSENLRDPRRMVPIRF